VLDLVCDYSETANGGTQVLVTRISEGEDRTMGVLLEFYLNSNPFCISGHSQSSNIGKEEQSMSASRMDGEGIKMTALQGDLKTL
jgi:hypothetical protein